jgi:hypothetical protein
MGIEIYQSPQYQKLNQQPSAQAQKMDESEDPSTM